MSLYLTTSMIGLFGQEFHVNVSSTMSPTSRSLLHSSHFVLLAHVGRYILQSAFRNDSWIAGISSSSAFKKFQNRKMYLQVYTHQRIRGWNSLVSKTHPLLDSVGEKLCRLVLTKWICSLQSPPIRGQAAGLNNHFVVFVVNVYLREHFINIDLGLT